MAQLTAPRETNHVLRATARGGALNLFGAVCAGAGGVAITWLVAATLGPSGAGVFFAATSVFLLTLAAARLGTPTGLVYWVARLRRTDPAQLRAVVTAAIIPVMVSAFAFTLLLLCLADTLASWSTKGAGLATALRLLSPFLPTAALLEALLAVSRGFGRMRPTVVIDKLARTLMQLVLLVLAAWWQAGAVTMIFAWAAPYLPAALAAWWAPRTRRQLGPSGADWRQLLRPFWIYTAPRALAGIAQLALQRLDILLVAAFLGFAPAAVYTIATRFVVIGQLVCGAVGTAAQPRVATAWSAGDITCVHTLYRSTTAWIVLTCWPWYLLVALHASWYLRIFGSAYDIPSAVTTVWILAGGMLLSTACGAVETMLTMVGRSTWQLYNVAGAVVVNIGLDVWLLPSLGIVGAAIGWCAAIAVKNLLPLLQLARAHGLHPAGSAAVTAMALAAVSCGLLPGVAMWSGPWCGLAVTLICLLGYAGSAWRLREKWGYRHVK